MVIHKQLKAIVYSFVVLLILILMLIGSGIFGIKTLQQRQVWVDHTNYVMNQIEIAEKEFSSADYAGRNQVITGVKHPKIDLLRGSALEKIKEIKQIVEDNPVQLTNLDSLMAAIDQSYKIQDEQFDNVIKTDDSLIYKIDTTSRRIQYNETIDALFIRIKLNEMNLLRDDRMPRLAMWQWRIVYITGVIVFLLGVVSVILFVFHVRLLQRNILVTNFIEEAKHRSDTGKTPVATSDLEKIQLLIRNNADIALQHITK